MSKYPFLRERDYVTFGSLLSEICLSSVVCNAGAPYIQEDETFGNISSPAILCPGHPLTSVHNFTDVVLVGGVKR